MISVRCISAACTSRLDQPEGPRKLFRLSPTAPTALKSLSNEPLVTRRY
jgi:hypothetical protein